MGDGRLADRQLAASAIAWSPSVVVGGLTAGERYQLRVTARGDAATWTSAPVMVLADAPPAAPAATILTQVTGGDGLRVTWAPSPLGLAATGAQVQLYQGPAVGPPVSVGYLVCHVGCTSAMFRGVRYGERYLVRVVPTNDAGAGPAATSNVVTPASPCPGAATCVGIDATTKVGAVTRRAQGFLNSLYPKPAMIARTAALHPTSWRGSPTYQPDGHSYDWSSWDAALASGAPTIMLLSNLWSAETDFGQGARPPWSDWGAYARWVTDTVQRVRASGRRVSYWEVQNEPSAPSYFNASDRAAATAQDYLDQFLVAYRAITAADPTAKVIGPSLSHFADYPGQYDRHEPDLVSFLDFAASTDMHLAAIAWHEIDTDPGARPHDLDVRPEYIGDHVAEARRLIAERPALGSPEVWVTEYGHPTDYAVPGWALADIAALERSAVDRAGRTCWPELSPQGTTVNDCAAANLDGLLGNDGSTTRANYWVYDAYARMPGSIVAATSSDATIPVLAASDGSTRSIVVMLGRAVSCLGGVNPSCPEPPSTTPGPAQVTATVRIPWSGAGARLRVERIPANWGAVPAPTTVSDARAVVKAGTLTVALPPFADGDVYVLTING